MFLLLETKGFEVQSNNLQNIEGTNPTKVLDLLNLSSGLLFESELLRNQFQINYLNQIFKCSINESFTGKCFYDNNSKNLS